MRANAATPTSAQQDEGREWCEGKTHPRGLALLPMQGAWFKYHDQGIACRELSLASYRIPPPRVQGRVMLGASDYCS